VGGYVEQPMPSFDEALSTHPTLPGLVTRVRDAAAGSPHLDVATRSAISARIEQLLAGTPPAMDHAAAHGPSLALAEQLILDVRALAPTLVEEVRIAGGDAAVVAAASSAALTAALSRARVALGEGV
jgi:hypothetical protein